MTENKTFIEQEVKFIYITIYIFTKTDWQIKKKTSIILYVLFTTYFYKK